MSRGWRVQWPEEFARQTAKGLGQTRGEGWSRSLVTAAPAARVTPHVGGLQVTAGRTGFRSTLSHLLGVADTRGWWVKERSYLRFLGSIHDINYIELCHIMPQRGAAQTKKKAFFSSLSPCSQHSPSANYKLSMD